MLNKIGFTEDSIQERVRKLNWTYSDTLSWQLVKAKNTYEDLFGHSIEPGEMYFRLSVGFAQDLIMDLKSMEQFLYIQFITNPKWDQDAAKCIRKGTDRIREIMDDLRRPGAKGKSTSK